MIKKAGVIGWPLKHTKSPLIHCYWLEKYGISGSYDANPIAPDDLKTGIQKLIDAGYSGFNVTVPHKETIMTMMDILEDSAQKIGAVNTVVLHDGKRIGRNTDAFGFIENLRESAPEFTFKGTALVLGAGGAARAVVYALKQQGMDVCIVNRTKDRADILAKDFGASSHAWSDIPSLLENAALVVNTTSLGMTGQPSLEINLKPTKACICDIVYTPLETDLLKQAKALNLKTVTGIGMLLHQARPAFEAWFGIMPDVDAPLRAKVLA